MEVDSCDCLSMRIIVLNQPFASQVVEFDLFICGAWGQAGTVGVELAIVDGAKMITEVIENFLRLSVPENNRLIFSPWTN